MAVDYHKIITIEPGQRGGQPCIRGMRITVYDVLEYLAGGMSEAEILADFPELTREDILACYAFAAEPQRRIRHPQPAAPEPQPENPPFRVNPNHSKLAPGVESMNLNHLVSELDDELFLAKMERDRTKESEPEPAPEPQPKKPFRVIPHHCGFAPGVDEMQLNRLNSRLEEEELIAKMERSQ